MAMCDSLLNLVDALNTLKEFGLTLDTDSYKKVTDRMMNAKLKIYDIGWNDSTDNLPEYVMIKMGDVYDYGYIASCVIDGMFDIEDNWVVFSDDLDDECVEKIDAYLERYGASTRYWYYKIL